MHRLVPFLHCVLLLAACAEEPPPALSPAEAAETDAVLDLLRAADPGEPLRLSSDSSRSYELSEQIERLDAEGRVVASRSRRWRVGADGFRLLAADSTGTFGDEEGGRPTAPDPIGRVLPEEPAFLGPRGRETYRFALAPDTALGGRPVRVAAVEARPGEGDDQALRAARLYLDAATGRLVGATVRRRQASPLFGEESTLSAMLRPTPEGRWLPDRTRYDAAVRAPFSEPRRFRLTRQYTFER